MIIESGVCLTLFLIFQRLGIHFDIYSGESFHQDQVQEVVQQLQRQGLLKTTEYVMKKPFISYRNDKMLL